SGPVNYIRSIVSADNWGASGFSYRKRLLWLAHHLHVKLTGRLYRFGDERHPCCDWHMFDNSIASG
ncbi:MAG: hypothetical protein ACK5PF_11640, partial [bacterium]